MMNNKLFLKLLILFKLFLKFNNLSTILGIKPNLFYEFILLDKFVI